MKELEKHLNECYVEREKDCVFVYKLVKVNGQYGLLCHEAQIRPYDVYVYEDFPGNDIEYLKSFIPELNSECKAQLISEGHYYALISEITRIFDIQQVLNNDIKNFVEENGLGKKV